MKCPTILYAVNLWLKPVSATGADRNPQIHVSENYSYLFNLRPNSWKFLFERTSLQNTSDSNRFSTYRVKFFLVLECVHVTLPWLL